MKVDILMATYNGEKYLRPQIESILDQTFKDFNLIICDDCSKDNTWKILEEYAQKDSRIKIIKNEKNLGYNKNFEKLLGFVTSVTLCYLIKMIFGYQIKLKNLIKK